MQGSWLLTLVATTIDSYLVLHRAYVPAPPLSDFVDHLWLYDGDAPPHAKERVLPTGTIELVINLREDALRLYDREDHDACESFGGTVICGAHSEFFVIDTAQQASVMGVHFKPGGAFPFLGLPAGELHDIHVSLDRLWGGRAGELRERLLAAETADARFRILEQTLLAQGASRLQHHPAVAFALKEFHLLPHARTITDVTAEIGLSPRRFIQVFRDEVGLTPKVFCRLRRFQDALRRIGRTENVPWIDVALACGYFDQAHFLHDFRAFAGLTPTAYRAHCDARTPNHVPLSD